MSKVLTKAIGVLALSVGLGSAAFAGQWAPIAHSGRWASHNFGSSMTAAAPEIDPAGALSALTLLLGGLAVVRGSRSKK